MLLHYCPVKYFAESDKPLAVKAMAGKMTFADLKMEFPGRMGCQSLTDFPVAKESGISTNFYTFDSTLN